MLKLEYNNWEIKYISQLSTPTNRRNEVFLNDATKFVNKKIHITIKFEYIESQSVSNSKYNQ